MCPQTPSLSPEYSHKAGLQAVITSMPLQIRPVTQRRPRRARYNGPDRTWASELGEAALWDAFVAGRRPAPIKRRASLPALSLSGQRLNSGDFERRVAFLPSLQHLPSEGPVRPSHLVPKASLDGGDAALARSGSAGVFDMTVD